MSELCAKRRHSPLFARWVGHIIDAPGSSYLFKMNQPGNRATIFICCKGDNDQSSVRGRFQYLNLQLVAPGTIPILPRQDRIAFNRLMEWITVPGIHDTPKPAGEPTVAQWL